MPAVPRPAAGAIRWKAPADLAVRLAFRLGFPLARLWWRLRRPRHEGALVAVWVGADLLLLRSSYRRAWNLPGGGVRPGEAPEAAARRELVEELGLAATALRPAGIVGGLWDGRRDRVHLFELSLERLPALRLDNREVVAARLVAPAELDAMVLTAPVAAYLAGRGGAAALPLGLAGEEGRPGLCPLLQDGDPPKASLWNP